MLFAHICDISAKLNFLVICNTILKKENVEEYSSFSFKIDYRRQRKDTADSQVMPGKHTFS